LTGKTYHELAGKTMQLDNRGGLGRCSAVLWNRLHIFLMTLATRLLLVPSRETLKERDIKMVTRAAPNALQAANDRRRHRPAGRLRKATGHPSASQ